MAAEVQHVLDNIRASGFDGIGGLLTAMMESENANIQRRLNRLVDGEAGQRLATLVMQRQRWSPSDVPEDIINLVIVRMTRDAEAIRKDNQCQVGAKGVTPEFINTFSFQSLGARFAQLAPTLWCMMCRLGDIEEHKANEYLTAAPEDLEDLANSDAEADDAAGEAPVGDARDIDADSRGAKKVKDKVLAVIMAIAAIAFTRSRNCNATQMMLGYYLFATRTGKRVMGVLNHLGICTSYDTVRSALQGNGEKVRALITERSSQHPIALTYDNLTIKHHAATETLLNKSSMRCFTATGVIFLRLTPSLARRLGKTIEEPGQGVVPVSAPDRTLPGESFQSYRRRRSRPEAPPDDKPGLPADVLLRPNPDWASLTPEDIINTQADEKYWGPIAKALMCRIIKKFYPKELKHSEEEAGIHPFAMPHVYKVPKGASDMHTLATLQLDESTID
jgi:hypothetical protein